MDFPFCASSTLLSHFHNSLGFWRYQKTNKVSRLCSTTTTIIITNIQPTKKN
uniref:Uncharacterized protein n=1 Tax=Rhizophora mucronata TaxID=61149 RepID=A0A2P2PSY2_RHIMU